MTDKYWQFVEPIWKAISIYRDAETFSRQFAAVTEKQRVLFASHLAQSEIMNGGLGQFFSNPTGISAPEAAAAFEQLGMPKCASILKQAMLFFGDPYPRERKVREESFERVYEEFGEKAIPMLELEDAMATEIEEENGGFWDAADRYAEKC